MQSARGNLERSENLEKIIEYKICQACRVTDLQGIVSQGLAQGFQPLGGSFVSSTALEPCYTQTMVKYESEGE